MLSTEPLNTRTERTGITANDSKSLPLPLAQKTPPNNLFSPCTTSICAARQTIESINPAHRHSQKAATTRLESTRDRPDSTYTVKKCAATEIQALLPHLATTLRLQACQGRTESLRSLLPLPTKQKKYTQIPTFSAKKKHKRSLHGKNILIMASRQILSYALPSSL